MQTLKMKLVGRSPLLMHSDRGANPLDPAVKEHKKLTSVRKKTDEIHEAIAKSEWMLSLYFDPKLGPYMPTNNVRASIIAGASINRLGAAVKRGVQTLSEREPVQYEGPRDPERMWSDQNRFVDCRSVVVNQSRLMRYRPKIESWTLTVEFQFDPEVIRKEDLVMAAENAGRMVGIGDFRPGCSGNFGRFDVEVLS